MLYIAYMDEFGHMGPYISHGHLQYKTHPAFGIGGLVLPYPQVRQFATFFFQLKNRLLGFEIRRDGIHPAQWEKKGSSLYRTENVLKYPELRKATFRLFNKISECGGYAMYVGAEKPRADAINSKELFHSTLVEIIKRLDEECAMRNAKFLLILDEQEKSVMRAEIVERSGIEMFGGNKRKTLIEPPVQAESHLYQTLQCADWLCGLFGRMSHLQFEPDHKAEFQWFETYFKRRLDEICRRSNLKAVSI